MNIFKKDTWSRALRFTGSALTGLKRLAESSSLVITSVATIYFAWHQVGNVFTRDTLFTASGIIALRGAYEFLRCLAGQGKG